jgi:hypothetical protein
MWHNIGTRTEKRSDVFGQTVNTSALIKSNGPALSQQLFRKLKPETRRFFKKHTPPIILILKHVRYIHFEIIHSTHLYWEEARWKLADGMARFAFEVDTIEAVQQE